MTQLRSLPSTSPATGQRSRRRHSVRRDSHVRPAGDGDRSAEGGTGDRCRKRTQPALDHSSVPPRYRVGRLAHRFRSRTGCEEIFAEPRRLAGSAAAVTGYAVATPYTPWGIFRLKQEAAGRRRRDRQLLLPSSRYLPIGQQGPERWKIKWECYARKSRRDFAHSSLH